MPAPMSPLNAPSASPWTMMANTEAQGIAPRTSTDDTAAPIAVPEDALKHIPQAIADGHISAKQPIKVVEKTKTTSSADPKQAMTAYQRAMEMVDQAQEQAGDSYQQQKQGIGNLEDQINAYKQNPRGGIDYSPLVAFSKFLNPHDDVSAMQQAAQSIKPPTPQEQADKNIQLQNLLQQRKEGLSKVSDAQLASLIKAERDANPLNTQVKESMISKNYGMAAGMSQRGQLQKDRQDFSVFKDTADAIKKDTQLGSLQTTANNLSNAINNFNQGGSSKSELEELQNTVRSNLGIKGAGGVDERNRSRVSSVGMDFDGLNQFLTGNVQSVKNTSPELVNQILNIANLELKNKVHQAQLRQSTLRQMAGGVTQRVPEYGKMLDATGNAALDQMPTPAPEFNADPSKMTPAEQKAWMQQHGG